MSSPAAAGQGMGLEIAVVGMAGRFPGASSIEEFWQNLRNGVDCIRSLSDEELLASGVDRSLLLEPSYVKARGIVEGAELFDASFFGYSPREAQLMDPQQRVFLEHAWEALENAGYGAGPYGFPIGVYCSASMNTYLLNNLSSHGDLMASIGVQARIGNEKDFLATRVSYKLDLKGPSLVVQTACSSSLVAVHVACQALLTGECDMALAGGSSISVPQRVGYLFEEDGILSPDGKCRAFDSRAQGTVRGDGVGVVVLRRLSDAVAAGDSIRAVIKGSAINNDGSVKVSYTAPSVQGQAEAIARALEVAEVPPETVGLIEAHGTATALGDLIEVGALTQVFREKTRKERFCAIGSVKSNIGHLDAAAGIAGLIKAILALEHAEIPASLHFREANPRIDFSNSPFYVNAERREWRADGVVRRAGVSSFGMGGTNAHVVLEEAPPREEARESRPAQLLVLSAKAPDALEQATRNLRERLLADPAVCLADVAYSLQVGRKAFEYRRALVCSAVEEAVKLLGEPDKRGVSTARHDGSDRPVAFMFPGQGAQYVNMGLGLYESEAVFRAHVDDCCGWLSTERGIDLRGLLYPGKADEETAARELKQTAIAQPALFVIEYALARLWMSWGVHPRAMVGHSIGEYVAACLAGVFSLENALQLVSTRGRLMQGLPGGAMLAVPLPEAEIREFVAAEVALAAVNAPSVCVVSGPGEEVDRLETALAARGVNGSRLHTSHAFHSAMMDPILIEFTEEVRQIDLKPPEIPFISNVSGTWIVPEEATDARYWARHLRQTVLFSQGVQQLLEEPQRILLEVGPGRTLSTLAGRNPGKTTDQLVVSSIRHPNEKKPDLEVLLNALGHLWVSGAELDWTGFAANEVRRRLPLPTYPFQRERHWIEPRPLRSGVSVPPPLLSKTPDIGDWFYLPSWRRTDGLLPIGSGVAEGRQRSWLVFADACGLGTRLVERLEEEGYVTCVVTPGPGFRQLDQRRFTIDPGSPGDYDSLVRSLQGNGTAPDIVVHLWSVTTATRSGTEDAAALTGALDSGFYSLLFLARALDRQGEERGLRIAVVSSDVQEVTGEEALTAEKVMVLGPSKVIPQEFPSISCRCIDVLVPESQVWPKDTVDRLMGECLSEPGGLVVAYRGNHRWVQDFEAVRLDDDAAAARQLREGGVYLITGGLGRIGLAIAEYLARVARARLVLLGRSAFPQRHEWREWVGTHAETDDVSQKIEALLRMEELGAEVMVVRADVADAEELDGALQKLDARFGALHGVIHGAGTLDADSFTFIQETGREECERQFRPKLQGLLVLERLLRGRELDFCILLSSLSSVLGGLKAGAYSAANLYMDAFAQRRRGGAVRWLSVNWDGWLFDPEQRDTADIGANVVEFGMTPEEGTEVFSRLLAVTSRAQVIVSSSELEGRIGRWIRKQAQEGTTDPEGRPLPGSQPRADLATAYSSPRNEVEKRICAIWEELLGLDRVGIHDDFFELGGHSLLGTQILSRVRKVFQLEVPLRLLLEKPSVAELAMLVVQRQAEQLDEQTLVEALAEVEELSEEEVQRELAESPVSSVSRDRLD